MWSASYYRERAEQFRHLQFVVGDERTAELLAVMAIEYGEIASDIEQSAAEIRHMDKLTGRQREEILTGLRASGAPPAD
jgi:hypothetical protein